MINNNENKNMMMTMTMMMMIIISCCCCAVFPQLRLIATMLSHHMHAHLLMDRARTRR